MLQNYFVRNPLITQSLLFSLFATFVAFTGYAVMHVSLRRGANEPQVQMAADAVAALGSGKQAEQAIPAGRVDLRRSLQPFVIFYDENGRVVTSSLEVVLDGRTPAPPSGVFAYARKFGENRLTWQPSPGVRIAAEMRYVAAAPQPGFVLAGRSLKTTERGDDLLFRLALLGWLAMLGAALSSVLLLHRYQFRLNPA